MLNYSSSTKRELPMNNIKRRDMHEMAMKAVYDELTYVHMG